jgi:hypothetical protein
VTLPHYRWFVGAERWTISSDGVPHFAGVVPLLQHATAAVWLDLDGDGGSELVCAEQGGLGRGLEILSQSASGPVAPGRYIDLGQGYDVVNISSMDLNADGRADLCLAIADLYYGFISRPMVLLGTADGSFAKVIDSGLNGMRFAPLTMSGDSYLDLLCWSFDSQAMWPSFGYGDGTFQGYDPHLPADGPPLTADFDGDGALDVVAGRFLYRGVVGGEPVPMDTLANRVRRVVDLDHDGRFDLVAIGEGRVNVAKGKGGLEFQPFLTLALGAATGPGLDWLDGKSGDLSAVVDLNGDGWYDIVCASAQGRELEVVLGKSNGEFFQPLLLPTGGNPVQVELADVTGADGRLDLVVLARGSRRIEVRAGAGYGRFGPAEWIDLPAGPRAFALGDLDEDGVPDLAVACDSARSLVLFRGTDHGFVERVDHAATDSLLGIVLCDLDEDGHLDVFASSRQSNSGGSFRLEGWRGQGTMEPVAFTPANGFLYKGSFALRDWDGDGHLDLVLPNWSGSLSEDFRFKPGDGHGDFELGDIHTNISGVGANAPFDIGMVEGHAAPALVLAARDSVGFVMAWLDGRVSDPSGHGFRLGAKPGSPPFPGELPPHELPPTPVQLKLADVTADGINDVVVLSQMPATLTVLAGLADGSFGEPASHVVGYQPTSFALGDVDGDGLPDAAVANGGSNDVLILRHRVGQPTAVNPGAAPTRLGLRTTSLLGAARPRLQLTLANSAPAIVEVFDTQGRRLAEQRVESPVVGERTLDLDVSRLNATGLLFVRLRQGAEFATTRLVRLR